MGDFGAGVDVENNMLSEMSQRSDNLAQHYDDQMRNYNTMLRGVKSQAKSEVESVRTPQQIAEDTAQFTQVGQRIGAARGVFKNVYGSNKLAYLKGLGRTGEETTLGIKPLAQAVGKGARTAASSVTGSGFTPSSVTGAATERSLEDTPTESLLGDSPSASASPEYSEAVEGATDRFTPPAATSTEPPAQASSAAGGSAPEGAAVSEGTAAESSTGIPAVETMTTRGAVSTAADLGAKAGVGLGIVGGSVSLAQDFSGGHFHLAGDNKAEKAGNALSMASGALDTLGLAIPPLAILGGLAGVGSAIADIFGHEKDAKDKVDAAQTAVPPPPKDIQVSAASSAVGQVASQGSDTLHSIAGTTF